MAFVRVNISELLGHLDAYDNNKHIDTSLRLCNRRGNKDAAITKLPTELIDMIIEELELDTYSESFEQWDKGFACFEGRCERQTEFDPAEIRTIIRESCPPYLCSCPPHMTRLEDEKHDKRFDESCVICRGDFDSYPGSSRCSSHEYLAPWLIIYWTHLIHRRLAHPWAGYD